MDEGVLPNFARLRQQGSFHRLRTTLLAESPVAWTSFQTGCNPGKHRIFDFLVPNRKSHLPELCSARVAPPKRSLPLGPFRIPLGKPLIEAGRRSQPFWKILGDHGIVSSILRVPITFPAEKFNGTLLSAMSVPDLNGSQGTYYYFSSDSAEQLSLTSGVRVPLDWTDGVARGVFTGPENSLRTGGGELQLPFEVHAGSNGNAELRLDGVVHRLTRREYTPWITLDFKPGLAMTVTGIVRFYLLETAPHLKLYMTPINIDPDRPALPISHPFTYAIYLSKTQGRYSTLGLCEDTSAPERRGHRRGRVPQTDLSDPRGTGTDVLRRPRQDVARRCGLRVRHHRPATAHVLPASRRATPGQPGAQREAQGRHPGSSISRWTRWSVVRWRRSTTRRRCS